MCKFLDCDDVYSLIHLNWCMLVGDYMHVDIIIYEYWVNA